MQHAPAPDREETPPLTTPDASMHMNQPAVSSSSPDSAHARDGTIDTIDPLVANAAKKIAVVINDFKRELDQRDGTWVHAQGSVELALKANQAKAFELIITSDEHGHEYPVTVHATIKKPEVITIDDGTSTPAAAARPTFKPIRRASGVELGTDIVSRKKHKHNDADDQSNKRPRTNGDEDNDIISLITKEDLDDLLVKLRDDTQDGISGSINHVQRLLRRFKEEEHDKSKCNFEQPQIQQSGAPFRNSLTAARAGPGASFPSPDVDCDDVNASVSDLVRREAGLISRQVKWVEDCRRLANEVHVKREDTWRTTSAGFHDQQRQDRENFQHRMIHESTMHSQALNQILNEVKAIGLYAQNMKWETPSTHLNYVSPQVPTPPAFPTQPLRTPSGSSQQDQRAQFHRNIGHGPGTQNG